jgi:hypothetical protein
MSSGKYLKAGDCVTAPADATYQHSTFMLVLSYLKESLLSTTRNDQTISIVSKFVGHRSHKANVRVMSVPMSRTLDD